MGSLLPSPVAGLGRKNRMESRALQVLQMPTFLSGSHGSAGLARLSLAWWLLTDSHHGTRNQAYC